MPTDYVPTGAPLTTPGGALDELRQMRRMVRDDRWLNLVWPLMVKGMGRLCGLDREFTQREAALELIRFAMTLDAAEPVLWRNSLWEVVRESEPAYPWQGQVWTPEMFLTPVQYWAMETDGTLHEDDTRLRDAGLTGVFSYVLTVNLPGEVQQAVEQLRHTDSPFADLLRSLGAGQDLPEAVARQGQVCHTLVMTYGPYGLRVPMPTMFALGTPLNPHSFALAARLDFMRSTIVESAQTRADRGARRRWTKDLGTPPPSVRVVSLRRNTHAAEDGESHAVEWHHRWVVSGHWRKQRVGPGLATTRPTFIASHIKGPEGLPLLPPAERIWSVER